MCGCVPSWVYAVHVCAWYVKKLQSNWDDNSWASLLSRQQRCMASHWKPFFCLRIRPLHVSASFNWRLLLCPFISLSLYLSVTPFLSLSPSLRPSISAPLSLALYFWYLIREQLRHVNPLWVTSYKTVWSVTLYGADTWTMRKEDVKRIEAFEMWIWRRMERISYTEHRTNEEVLKKLEEKEIQWI